MTMIAVGITCSLKLQLIFVVNNVVVIILAGGLVMVGLLLLALGENI